MLPSDGNYIVQVYLMRNEARRDGKAQYSVDISITPTSAQQVCVTAEGGRGQLSITR